MAEKIAKKIMRIPKQQPAPEPPPVVKKIKKLLKTEEPSFTGKSYADQFNAAVHKTVHNFQPLPRGWKSVTSIGRSKSGPNYTCKSAYAHWYQFQKTIFPTVKVLIWETGDERIDLIVPETALSCYDYQNAHKDMPESKKTSSMPTFDEFKRLYKEGKLSRP